MILKALNSLQEDFGKDIDDFFFSYQAFIGPEEITGAYEVYDFNLISIKRLEKDFPDYAVMLNRGWMIAKNFDEAEVKNKVETIIKESMDKDDEVTYSNIATYLRKEES